MTMNALQRALTEIVPAARVELEREDSGTVLVHLHGVPPEVGMAVADELRELMPLAVRLQVSTTRQEPERVYGAGPRAVGMTQAYEYSDVTITIGGQRYDGLEHIPVPVKSNMKSNMSNMKAIKAAKKPRVSRYELIDEDWLE